MQKNTLNIAQLASNDACFDLQFRKDTKHERTNSPTYYRWKAQFVITGPKESQKKIEKVKRGIGCGNIHVSKNQVRFSVQNINHVAELVIPYFTKHQLIGNKKKDFEMWQRAVEIIHKNKGKYLASWKKNELLSLIHIQKSASKYKNNPREPRWIQVANSIAKSI